MSTPDQYIGGQRLALVDEALYAFIHSGLNTLGWFNSSRQIAPVRFIDDAVEVNEDLEDNTVTVTAENYLPSSMEMGSNLAEKRRSYYVDVYAENLSVGKRLAADLTDLLEFRFNFQSGEAIDVLDLLHATPTMLFRIVVDRVAADRSRIYEREFNKYWFQISFDILDYYGSQD